MSLRIGHWTQTVGERLNWELALQLHFPFEVRTLCFGLVGASPKRPCDDAGWLDALLRELEGDATDFLDRPTD
jgi:hypothetical protein